MLIFGILTKGFGLPVLVLLIGNPRKFTSKVCSLKALFFFLLGLKKKICCVIS